MSLGTFASVVVFDRGPQWCIDAMVHEGETGKIVEVEDEAEHKTIEVWLE